MNDAVVRSWRFKVGIALFALGLISPLFVPLVTALDISTKWKTTFSGLLLLGTPEVLWLIAAAVMGKSGFNYIKSKVFGFMQKYLLPETVGPIRYYLGLVMFTLPLVFAWLAPYAQQLLPNISIQTFSWHLGSDLLLLASLFVLGGEFWDKLRALFVYSATAHFTSPLTTSS